ncbi:MAG TPA: HAMP domain-containing protein [Trebonia sp.]|jgi:signal transduction histidine kinase/CheY-like chemotaxis protein/HAMP domain-containing protein|nr:HAMP domain-containing protein [Trebonia sp.]
MTDVDHQPPRLDRAALEQLLAGLTAVRGGDFSRRLAPTGDPLVDEIASVFNGMADQLDQFTAEVTRVAREVGTEGKLGGQAHVPGVSGTWKDLTDSVNAMAGNLTTQVRNIAQVATAVAKGDLSQKIGVEAQGEILELKTTLNTMVDQLSGFADEVTRVAREVGTQGNLGGQAEVRGVSGTWKDLTDNVNSMATNLTSQVRNIAQVTTAVAQGDLTKKIDVDARGEILELKTTINTMVDQLSAFAAEVTRVAREVGREGKLGGQAEVEGVSGTWKRLTENVNELAGNLTRQVRAIGAVTSAVAAGDLTRTISVEAEGEVAELKDNINAMVRSLRESVQASRDQEWLKSNLASIGSMMQGHRDLEVVAELIMEELAPLLGAQHGTFFLSEEAGGETRLRLIAGYGLRADKDAPIQYRIGQSLIGQVAKSKRAIVVDEIPPGYIRISSGLGEAPPANLAVMPIKFEDSVMGVVELASFSKFTPIQIDFLEQLTETLGVSVNAIIANARTDTLLGQSQRLTAELQARSSELQSRSEELTLSNADLEEKAALLAAQKQDIEAKNAEISRAREEIEERARQLGLASQYKSQFLANMSHELRTPLNSLLILARLLAQNPGRNLTAKQVEYANVIHSAGSDLLQLINDILDLSKVEAGRLDVHPERFLLSALVEDLRATFGPLTAEKGLDFAIAIEPSAPAELVTDRQRLRQVLGNLLSNAVKFTENGQVELRVRAVSAATAAEALADSVLPAVGAGDGYGDGDGDGDGDGSLLAFSVTDTGIGIAPENLAVIFGAFQQGDGTLNRRFGGTGLGLSIASEVTALLGGRITAESDLGRGSTFTLYAPATLPDIPAADVAGGEFGAAGRVDGADGADGAPEDGSDGLARLAALAEPGDAAGLGDFGDDASGPGDPGRPGGPAGARAGGAADWYEVNDLGALDTLAVDLAATDELAGGDGLGPLGGNDEAVVEGPSGHTVTTVAQRVKTAGAYIAALAAAAAPEGLGAAGPGTAVRNVLVFEGSGSGLLTLLAHSAISDLTETDGTIGVSTATSPAQAITTLMAEPFRCVVVDLAQSSAVQFLEQVREHQELRDIPVLAHSADRPADGHGQGRLAVLRSNHGRLELLPSLDHLRERIGLYLSATRPGQVPPLASDAPAAHSAPGMGRQALQGKRVLVIDDDARNVFALSSTLELHGMQVAHASDGRQGIEALLATPGTDLILMDIMMPGMDGYAAMTVIRQMPQFATLPIIAVTARAMPSDRQKSLAAGASDYVTKPVDTDELLNCIERWLAGS